jgi:hypothetical protein
MSKPIDALPRGMPSRRQVKTYEYLDGRPHVLEPGVDYRTSTKLENVRARLYVEAKQLGKRVKVRIVDLKVYCQAFDR